MNLNFYEFDKLSLSQLYEIIALRLEVFTLEKRAIYKDCDGKDYQAVHLVGTDENGTIIAYLRIINTTPNKKEYTYGRVCVKKVHRQKDYGKKLIVAAMDYIYTRFNQDYIEIAAQADVADFYKKLGYDIISDLYDVQGVSHLNMLHLKHN